MSNTFTIAWKETKSYFSTPTAYVVGAMFLALTGVFFVADITSPFAEASMRSVIQWFVLASGRYISDEALDLLDRLLRYDQEERIIPKEAMTHVYFKPIHESKDGLMDTG